MEASTTIRKMMAGNKIVVPAYQRAYSWDTPMEKSDRNTQTDVFVSDLEEYSRSNVISPYYFGHFLFEKNTIFQCNRRPATLNNHCHFLICPVCEAEIHKGFI